MDGPLPLLPHISTYKSFSWTPKRFWWELGIVSGGTGKVRKILKLDLTLSRVGHFPLGIITE